MSETLILRQLRSPILHDSASGTAAATTATVMGLDAESLSLQKPLLSAQQQDHVAEVELEVSVLSEHGLYLAPLGQCPVLPPPPPKESILTVGVQDDVLARVASRLVENQDAAANTSARFMPKMQSLFSNWMRAHVVFPEVKDGIAFVEDGHQGNDSKQRGEPDAGKGTLAPPRAHLVVASPSQVPEHSFFQGVMPSFGEAALNDTYFILALAAVARDKRILRNLFASFEFLHRGAATFRFFRYSAREEAEGQFVTIDTLLPVSNCGHKDAPKDHALIFGQVRSPRGAWLALLQKAYATFRGSYAALDEGCAVDALVHLSGGTPRHATWLPTLRGHPTAAAGPHDDVSEHRDNLWWFLRQTTISGDAAIAYTKSTPSPTANAEALAPDGSAAALPPCAFHEGPLHPGATAATSWSDACCVLFACEYDSTVEIPQDIYARLLGRVTKQGELHRLIKVRSARVKPRTPDEYQWEWSSSRWSAFAKKELEESWAVDPDGHDSSLSSISWWMTFDEFVERYNTVTAIANLPSTATTTHLHQFHPSADEHELPLHAPHFFLKVSKAGGDDLHATVAQRRVSYRAAAAADDATGATHEIPHNFRRLADVVVPPIAFGDESEDESPSDRASMATPGGSSRGSNASPRFLSGSASVLLDAVRNRNTVPTSIRVALPPSEWTKAFHLHLYRVNHPRKLDPMATVLDGRTSYELPVHGRLPWRTLTATHDGDRTRRQSHHHSDTLVSEYVAQVDLAEGFYNVVVFPDTTRLKSADACSTRGPVIMTATHRTDDPTIPACERSPFRLQGGVL